MEWYMCVLVGVYVWVYLSLMINVEWRKPIVGLVWSVVFVILLPFILIASIWTTIEYSYVFGKLKRAEYRYFDIGELSENMRVALRTLGVDEGSFVSSQGFKYEGFKVGWNTIYICNDGRVIHKKVIENKNEKFIYEFLKRHEVGLKKNEDIKN